MSQSTLTMLQDALRAIRRKTPAQDFPVDRAAMSDIRTGYLDGMPVKRLVITLRSPGCAWTRTNGGCIMCGHWAGTTQGILPSLPDTIAQFRNEIAGRDLREIRVLSLYNSGSMLNPEEFPPDALAAICGDIRRMPSIRKVVLETRAEYADPDYVRRLAAVLYPGARLSIAMGLETADDIVRELCLNKGFKTDRMQKTIEAVGEYADIQLYILAGIPFLTESEAVEDAVSAIRWAHRAGADEIHIEPLTIQRHTLLEALFLAGCCRLPSLHSLFEILRRVLPDIRPYVSPFMHMPLPEHLPEGCPRCTARLRIQLLETYNIRRDEASLGSDTCSCAKNWKRRLREADSRPLDQRVRDALEMLGCGATPC